MNVALAALAVAVVACGVIAVSAREARVAVLGLVLCAVMAPLIGTALPGPLVLAARLVAAILAGYLLWIAVRRQPVTRGSLLGWPVEALAAAAAAVAGFGAAGFAGPAGGPREAEAVAFALGYLALGPLIVGRDVLRLGIGLVLVVLAAAVGRVALAGSPSELEQLVLSAVIVAVAGAAAAIAIQTVRASGGLEVAIDEAPGVDAPDAGVGDRPLPARSAGARRILPGR